MYSPTPRNPLSVQLLAAAVASLGRARRRSTIGSNSGPPDLNLHPSSSVASGASQSQHTLPPIPHTPTPMGNGSTFWGTDGAEGSRSASPAPVLPISRSHSPATRAAAGAAADGWSAKYGSGNGYAPGARKFLGKHLRKLSTSLPTYNRMPFSPQAGFMPTTPYGRGGGGFFYRARATMAHRPRLASFFLLLVTLLLWTFLRLHHNPLSNRLRAASGGSKFVIILAANQGGGVMTWKGAKEWAVERDSIANKKAYAERWGYHLEIKDMSTKKRYAHEWRESWEKVDVIKQTMRQYPKAEW